MVRGDAAGNDLPLTRRELVTRAGGTIVGATALGRLVPAARAASPFPGPEAFDAEVATAWFDLALELVRTTPGFSPPVASRAFAYAGVALHEAVTPPGRRGSSLAGRLNGLTAMPGPADHVYHWPTVANSALASILRSLCPTTPSANVAAITALEHRFDVQARRFLPPGTHRRSVVRGSEVARHVFAWSTTDGGHEAFLRNFPPYVPPVGPGFWASTPPGFLPALQPSWGEDRPFVLEDGGSCAPGPPPAYSEDPRSGFYAEAFECYRAVTDLTPEQETVARFWSDDPGLTPTPPGHSISILTQAVRALDVPLGRAAAAYAGVGVAIADAFIACWSTKYAYNLLRPITYIRRLIDPAWTPLLITPPFPEYTSGHSVQSAAAAEVLTSLFGRIAFTDRTHEARGLPPRSFGSFEEAAREAALSRLYGGIHFRAAIERGLEQGTCIGRQVVAALR